MKVLLFLSIFITQVAWAEVKIGVILPFTGDFARYGEKIRAGLEKGAIPGVKFVFEDEGCDPRKAISAYQKLSSIDGIKLFLGPWCGSPQMAIAPLLKQHDQLAVLGASPPRAVYPASGETMLTVMHSIEQESIFNAQEIYKRGGKKVVIIFFENDFSRAHEKAFRDEFKGEVVETIAYSSADASTLKSVALRVKQLNPDTLYLPDAFPLMQGVLKQTTGIGLKNLKLFSVYSAQSDDVLKAVGSAGEGLFYSYPVTPGDIEALDYYPALASKLISNASSKCEGKPSCVLEKLKTENHFDSFGALENTIALKMIKGGAFVWVR